MLMVACISSHGFGHGARVAALLQALALREPHCRFVLSTALPAAFLQRSFVGLNYEHRPCQWDVGVVQAMPLAVIPLPRSRPWSAWSSSCLNKSKRKPAGWSTGASPMSLR